ncbi:Crp/Fnr family transcriptional regulator [Campylobacter ureolyticus]|uniref:Crp/Fnr family transcriptional regulator n=1 Tax=Campylobacter ureolyticus TaxID=827 RepID=UPI0022B40ACC|nr:Crp/Fnr family transcriptional regulator [Campylobacter ureolyticus]MCZ6174467.1 Crp/Fnr family transcriptional regulator [Campylobacter ureolyticus]
MLREIPIFKDLSNEELEKIENISIIKHYKKGEIFFLEGEKPLFLSILLDGKLKIYKTSPKGKEIFIHEILPINFVAELANFENITYPASSSFSKDSTILKIDYFKFEEMFLKKSQVAFTLLKSFSGKIKAMNKVIMKEIIWDSDGKVANFICENFEAFQTLKHSNMAKILNISPETFSRIITKFKKLNLLKTDENGKIVDFNKKGLLKYFKF